jgi:serine/threonine-protein kinase
MGVVLRAVDMDVQRQLAVKVMLGPPSADLEERFLNEARITGQLQHPGIPPVHEIGRLADGRPYFSMKLIQGSTMAELLSRRDSTQDDLPQDEQAVWRALWSEIAALAEGNTASSAPQAQPPGL